MPPCRGSDQAAALDPRFFRLFGVLGVVTASLLAQLERTSAPLVGDTGGASSMSRRRGTWRTGKATRVICCFGIIGLMGGVAAAHPPDEPAGSLDSAFGNGGVVLTPAQDAFSPAG